VDFIVETLKPFVDQNYRTLSGRDYTGIMGSSLGGLISQYGAIEHEDVFSKAGILSPAFWFNDPEIFNHSANTPKTGAMRVYQYAGGQEDNGSVVDDVNQMETVLLNNGFGAGELYKSINPNGEHSEPYWRAEFPDAYKWLFAGLNYSPTVEQAGSKLKIYPNPTDSLLFVEDLPDLPKMTYQIFGVNGQLIKKGKIEAGQSLDVSKLNTGTYSLQIFSKRKQVAVGQFLVK
jgi:hypothetical protein